MEMQVGRLRVALATLVEAVPKSPKSSPVLVNVCVEAGEARATDLDKYIQVPMPEAGEEAFLIPARQALEMLEYTPGTSRARLWTEKRLLKIQTEGTTMALAVSGDVEDFPPMPDLSGEKRAGSGAVDGDRFIGTLAKVAPYVATEDSRPVLTAVALILDELTTFVAADGFRLAYLTEQVGSLRPDKGGECTLLFPTHGKQVDVLAKLWKRQPGRTQRQLSDGASIADVVTSKRLLKAVFSDTVMSFEFGDVLFATRLISGNFPNYKQLIPEKQERYVMTHVDELYRAINQIIPVAQAAGNGVRLEWTADELKVWAKAEEAGSVEVKLKCRTAGDVHDGKVAVGYPLFLSYLKGKTGIVKIGMTTRSGPVTIQLPNEPGFVVMPFFMQWPGEAPVATPVAQPEGEEEEPEEDAAEETQESTEADAEQPIGSTDSAGDQDGAEAVEPAEPAVEAEEEKPAEVEKKKRGRKVKKAS